MGIATWVLAGASAFAAARLIRTGRITPWAVELSIALLVAAALGITATALDFGGLREPDWRAALFALFGSFAVLGLVRATQLARSANQRS